VSNALVTSEQVTLLSAEPEIQYVALRNIQLIYQKRPGILANEIEVLYLI
jgi:AP-1 complex subunit beta-1